ncbi:hypothetical protein, partial [Brevibacillus agri]|uniref:hypothetical protein n=1 Tax=Brevibacillus agri TaxID=51101 RepID=UPI002E1FD749|nr:hypothetical protein [Brevibacillus agri]
CLAVLVFGCEVENVIQNNLTIDGFIFYATLMIIYEFLNRSFVQVIRVWACARAHPGLARELL